jgi:release factor glutamine methyltransferase
MYISQIIDLGSKALKEKKIKSHIIDSELILSKILKISREKILILSDKKLKNTHVLSFNKLLKRRLHSEPIAYILKRKEFFSKNFYVNKNTLIPRPDTELLVEKILKVYKKKNPYILDIGTGSGCIILSLLQNLENSRGVGIDISKKALDLAKKNAQKMKLNKKCNFIHRSIEKISGYKFDLIVSNPPYIPRHQIKNLSKDIKQYEPRNALDGGNDGLDVIKKVIYKSTTILKRNGLLAIEIGNEQYKKVLQILSLYGFRNRFLIKDYQKNIRCLISVLK